MSRRTLNDGKIVGGSALGLVGRTPQQGRSKASFERIMAAARDLMLDRGTEEFTLQDVSARGSVSIGSIYLRFESKENLVRSVIGNALTELGEAEEAMLARLKRECRSLGEFVPAYVHHYGEVLREHAPILRLTMQRASHDQMVSLVGKDRAESAARATTGALLAYKSEFGGTDPETKADSAFHIIFATIARELSLGSTGESRRQYDWTRLERELSRMCLSYLRGD